METDQTEQYQLKQSGGSAEQRSQKIRPENTARNGIKGEATSSAEHLDKDRMADDSEGGVRERPAPPSGCTV